MKTAIIILADGFEDVEAVTPVDLLRRAGVEVVVAGLSALTATSSRGLTISCDTTLSQVPSDWDLLILPGGMPGAKKLAESPLVKQFVENGIARGVWVSAICASPAAVLGRHGFLKGKTFTGYPGTEASVTDGVYRLDSVVIDGKLITSRGVGTAAAFGLQLVEVLAGRETRNRVADDTLLR